MPDATPAPVATPSRPVLARLKSAILWAKARFASGGLPRVHPDDVLGDVLAYLDAHGLDRSKSFNHRGASLAIARAILGDAGHIATKAVAGVGPHSSAILIAFAVEEAIKMLASKRQAGPDADDATIPVVGDTSRKPAVAGKIGPETDGPGPERAA